MKLRIHYFEMGLNNLPDQEDHFIVEAETIEEIRAVATKELKKRGIGIDNAWSEEIEED